MTRDQLQKEVILNKDKKLILLHWCTGVGKSFGAIRLLNEIKPKKVLLLVAEDAHKNNWQEEFIKYNTIYNFNALEECNIIVECYASLKKYINCEFDLIIFDEYHHLSELRGDILSTVKVTKSIALSATFDWESRNRLINKLQVTPKDIYVSNVDLKEAIEWGILPKPDIYLIPLKLDNTIQNQMIIEKRGVAKLRKNLVCTYEQMWEYKKDKVKYPNYILNIRCTELQKYQYLSSKINYYSNKYQETHILKYQKSLLLNGSERKRYLGELKTEYVKKLISKLGHKRFICFCISSKQANILGKSKAIHFINGKINNKKILNDFQKEITREIYCIGMLVEGQNLKNIEVGIIIQLDGKSRPVKQKHGRVLRSDFPMQFIFYYKETKDEKYLNNFIQDINKEYIQTINDLENFVLPNK